MYKSWIMIKEHDYLFKIVLIGNSSVGKSSLLKRFTDQTFQESYLATIGVDFRFKTITVEGNVVKLQIWDTAGQERFRTITGTYYKGSQGILLVYDVTSPDSFDQLQSYWLKQIEKHALPDVRLIMLGNKSDLDRKVRKDEVEELCKKKGFVHMDVSAKTGENVTQAFETMAEELMKVHPKEEVSNQPMAVVEDIRRKRRQFQLQDGKLAGKKQKKCC